VKTVRFPVYDDGTCRDELIVVGNARYRWSYLSIERSAEGIPRPTERVVFLPSEAVVQLYEALGVRIAELKAAGHISM